LRRRLKRRASGKWKRNIRGGGSKSRYYNRNFLALTCIILIFSLTMFIRNAEIKRREFVSNENTLKEGLSEDKCLDHSAEKKDLLCETLIEQLGKPYVYGKDGPDSFDCSGLVEYVYSKIGVKLPRVVADQAYIGNYIEKENLRFGDIVFFSNDGINLTHAGIYIGSGYMIHAPKSGDVVKISSINAGYYCNIYKQAVRVLNNEL
jgi:hypothetical protein